MKKGIIATALSLFIPGMGQIYCKKTTRGFFILVTVLIVGNLNAIWLSLYGLTDPASISFWVGTLPRILHDIFAAYGIVFWIGQVVDAYRCSK